jgi:hypothetical protein
VVGGETTFLKLSGQDVGCLIYVNGAKIAEFDSDEGFVLQLDESVTARLIVFSTKESGTSEFQLFAREGSIFEITDYNQHGSSLTWESSLSNAVYDVEWTADLADSNAWKTCWCSLRNITGGPGMLSAQIPMAYRINARSYDEVCDEQTMWIMYSNAVVDARVAAIDEISDALVPITLSNTNLSWRTVTNGEGAVSCQVKVASYMNQWTAENYYKVGNTNLTGGYDQWVVPYPYMKQFCAQYQGTNIALRMNKLLGLPPDAANDTIVEFWVDPQYLIRPAPDPEITDSTAGLVPGTNVYLTGGGIFTVSTNYANWYNNTYDTRNYTMQGGVTNGCYPWTRLGYTYDWANSVDAPYGLSEFVIPGSSAWPDGIKDASITVEGHYSIWTYGK